MSGRKWEKNVAVPATQALPAVGVVIPVVVRVVAAVLQTANQTLATVYLAAVVAEVVAVIVVNLLNSTERTFSLVSHLVLITNYSTVR